MKNIFVIGILLGIGYMFYKNNKQGIRTIKKIGNNEIRIERGDNSFVAEIVSEYDEELLVFGTGKIKYDGWSPVAYADYTIKAAPFNGDYRNPKIGQAAARNAPMINLVAENGVLDFLKIFKQSRGIKKLRL